jgi:putative flippase GtrA
MAITLKRSDVRETQQFVRFMVVGLGGTLVDFSLLSLFKYLGMPTLPANTLSFSAGIINNFIWNRNWTFSDLHQQNWQKQLLQFTTISLVGLLINNLLMLLLEAPLSIYFHDWAYVPAKILATGVVVFWNYFGNRCWTFRK